jgi:glutamate carboxypeptidase
MRFIRPEDRHVVMAAIERIVAASEVPGASATLTIMGEFAPMVTTDATMKLFEHYAAIATQFGFSPTSEFAGGCSDAGYASTTGVPVICGIGPVGGKAHTPEEFVEVDTIIPRAQSLALAILRLG